MENPSDNPDPRDRKEPGSPAPDSPGKPVRRRRRRRRKVRQRIRIKRKASPFRKVKKLAEKVLWLLVIAAFIATLVVLMKELDISDDKAAKKRKRKQQGCDPRIEMLLPAAATGSRINGCAYRFPGCYSVT